MITPDWPAPKNIKALTLTKDDSIAYLPLSLDLRLLQQVHNKDVIRFPNEQQQLNADGAYTQQSNTACTIKTADCLAILLCNQQGTEVAALHGGWRGLSAGIIANGVQQFQSPTQELMAWLSPAICAMHYEVDAVVRDAFIEKNPNLAIAFTENRPQHWLCNLKQIATMQLQQLGINKIFTNNLCTFEQEEALYSFRRDPQDPGRLLHIIWIEE